MNSIYKVIGLMSGTSLDGLDIAGVILTHNETGWTFEISACETIGYPEELKEKLINAIHSSAEDLVHLDLQLGNFFGKSVFEFISKNSFHADFVSSHGHTVFHQPHNKLTVQIGNANCIHVITQLPVVFDFRSLDVQLGGQGAPLVPVGDHLLFSEFSACLNLGGIANISFMKKNERIAYDIGAFNIVLNYFAKLAGKEFDESGALASDGYVNERLLEFLSALKYYTLLPPKSLGFEEIQRDVINPIANMSLSPNDILRTYVEHLTIVFANNFEGQKDIKKILLTGGGAYNTFFIDLLRSRLEGIEFFIPEKNIVEFKEAIVFALLGVLRVRGEENVFSSVTGSERNSSSGSLIGKL